MAGIYYKALSERVAVLNHTQQMVTASRERHAELQADLAQKETLLEQIIASKPQVSLSGKAMLVDNFDGGHTQSSNPQKTGSAGGRAAFRVENKGRQIQYYLDSDPSKLREKLGQLPVDATVTGQMTLDAKKELVIKVDKLQTDDSGLEAHVRQPDRGL